jgi:hypothetical protein
MTFTHSDRPWERPRQTRGSGRWSLILLGQEFEGLKVTEALEITLSEIERAQPGFLDKLYNYRTPKVGRPIVSRNPEEIYPDLDTRHLIKDYAYRLGDSEWYYHANISADRCRSYLKIIAQYAGLDETPRLVKRS